jgi:ATP-binding cassette subfamily F protein 3
MATSLITSLIPSLDEVILDYLEGYLDEDEDPVGTFVKPLLECEGIKENQINDVCNRLNQILASKREIQKSDQDGPKTLDQVFPHTSSYL